MLVIAFPEKIGFETATQMSQEIHNTPFPDTVIFDLRKTNSIHSSFIGYLILAKHILDGKGISLHLHISSHIQRIFTMLDLNGFFFDSPSRIRMSA